MSYLVEIGREVLAYSPRQTAPQTFFAATPHPSISDAWRQNPKQKNMDYEAIKKEIKALIEEARQTPQGRVEAVLEPLRESMIEARREGVKLIRLYEKLEAAGIKISASSFAKYAQKHLRVKQTKGRPRPRQAATPEAKLPAKQESTKSNQPAHPIKPTAGKRRIATGNY